jgi:cyclohexyl-isocyanide hydratase
MPDPVFTTHDKDATKNVVFVLYDYVTLVDFTGATEVFNSTPGFVVHWLAPTMDPITTSENMKVLPTGSFDNVPDQIEILFIPGGNYKGIIASMFDIRYRDFISKTSKNAVWTGSVCTGAFILTAAGGLNNCQATTYWSQLENLSMLSDKYGISVDCNNYPRFLIEENQKRFSGGGISSSIDLALELVKRIVDNKTSEMAQLYIQYAPSPPNQSGDPSQAPSEITKEAITNEATYTAHMKEAVMELINEK